MEREGHESLLYAGHKLVTSPPHGKQRLSGKKSLTGVQNTPRGCLSTGELRLIDALLLVLSDLLNGPARPTRAGPLAFWQPGGFMLTAITRSDRQEIQNEPVRSPTRRPPRDCRCRPHPPRRRLQAAAPRAASRGLRYRSHPARRRLPPAALRG